MEDITVEAKQLFYLNSELYGNETLDPEGKYIGLFHQDSLNEETRQSLRKIGKILTKELDILHLEGEAIAKECGIFGLKKEDFDKMKENNDPAIINFENISKSVFEKKVVLSGVEKINFKDSVAKLNFKGCNYDLFYDTFFI